jgi:signal transduction histidine kinase/ActR/RegA family two-component response regulator
MLATPPTVSAAPSLPRLLLVDDEDSVRVTLGAVLEQKGYAVVTAATADDGQAHLQAQAFDVVIADLRLDGGRSGVEIISEALQRDLDMVTIVLTAYASTEAAVEALRGGATNFLPKPCNIQDLTDAINRGLGRRELLHQLREAQREAQGKLEAERLRAEAERGRERWRFLAEASQILDSSLDYRATLDSIARLAVPVLADWCAVDVPEEGQLQTSLAVAHVDPDKVERARELQRRYPSGRDDPSGLPRVLRSGEPELYPDMPEELLAAGARDEDHLRLIRELGPWSSALVVPLNAHGRTLGAMTFIAAESGRHYGPDDLAFAQELAGRAALAVDNARLHRDEIDARERAERDARRVAFLASAGEQLVSSLDYRSILDKLARLTVPDMADWCVVDVLERDVLEHVAVAHVDPAKEELAREVQRRARQTEARSEVIDLVMETAEPILVAHVPPETEPRGGFDAETVDMIRELAPASMICVPLVASGKAFGVVSLLMSDSGRHFRQDDVSVAMDLGRRAGLAIEHARLYREREQERDRLRQIVDQLPEGILVIDREGLLIASNDAADIMSGPYAPGSSPPLASRFQLAGSDGSLLDASELPLSRALSGHVTHGLQALLVDKERPHQLPVMVSAAPLRAPTGDIVGAMAIVQDITELKDLEQQKEAFLSAAAHDLKTPLTSVQGLVQLLRRQLANAELPRTDRLKSTLASIETGTKKMTGLIDELLDVSRLESSGRLGLDCHQTDLVKLARQVAGEQQATTRRHRLIVDSAVPELTGVWDSGRLDRAVTNLVTNAIKYSPKGGDVRLVVGLEAVDGAEFAVLRVSDEGIGIPAEDLDRVFERFERGTNVEAAMPGNGVGLSYVRQVVLQHGGSVSVQSQPGQGSAFTIRLPREAA